MNNGANKALKEVGFNLVRHSQEAETTARGLVTDLFPYIFTAAKRMSTRAISAYLQNEHGVKISAATIAKALREPKKHCRALAEEVEPAARIVANAHGVSLVDLLNDYEAFAAITSQTPGITAEKADVRDVLGEYDDALSYIRGEWFQQSPELRATVLSIIEESENAADNEDMSLVEQVENQEQKEGDK